MCSLIFFLKIFLYRTPALKGEVYWGLRSGKRLANNPEDATLGAAPMISDQEKELAAMMEKKWKLISLNETENIPYGLIFAWAQVIANCEPQVSALFVALFTVFRFAWNVAYVKSMQPWRTLTFALGELMVVAMGVNIVCSAFL